MRNIQVIEKPITDGFLDVVNVWRTIQGEGHLVGTPAVFIRLAGCNLRCPLCDTDYTTNRKKVSAGELRRAVEDAAKGSIDLIVVTGGEPLRQNLSVLTDEFPDFRIQIETNGTLWRELPWDRVMVVCSPKTPVIHGRLRPHIHSLKYVIEADYVDPMDGLPVRVLGEPCRPSRPWLPRERVYVQPADEGNEIANSRNMQAAVQSCMAFGYRLCIQTHKIIGLE